MNVLFPLQFSQPNCEWLSARTDLPRAVERFENGEVGVYKIGEEDAALILSVGRASGSGVRALWAESLGGRAANKIAKLRSVFHGVMQDIEAIAQSSQCQEIRVELTEKAQWKRKALARVGFEVVTTGAAMTMRKAL